MKKEMGFAHVCVVCLSLAHGLNSLQVSRYPSGHAVAGWISLDPTRHVHLLHPLMSPLLRLSAATELQRELGRFTSSAALRRGSDAGDDADRQRRAVTGHFFREEDGAQGRRWSRSSLMASGCRSARRRSC